MAKEILTCIIYRDDELIWESFLPAKAGLRRTEDGSVKRESLSAEEKPEVDADEASAAWSARVTQECGKIKGDVTLCFYSENILLRVVDLPPVPDEELKDVVYLQVDKFSPFPVDSMVVSHEVLKRSEESCKVLIGAIKKKIADKAGDLLNSAGIYPVRVDVSSLSRLRLLKDAGRVAEKGRHIILILEQKRPELMVIHDGLPIFFRSFAAEAALEGEEFENELISEISYTLMSLNMEEAERDFETQASIWHYGTAPQGMAARLGEECSCDVNLNSLDSLSSLAEGCIRRSVDTDCVNMDLTPESWKQADQSRVFKKNMIIAGSILLGLWILVAGGFFGSLVVREHQLKSLRKQKEKWHVPALEVRELRERAQTIEGYFDRSRSALESLREVSALQPPGIDLSNFIYRKNVEKKTQSVEVDGIASDRAQILEFQENLNKSGLFSEVNSGSVRPVKDGKYQFNFDIVIKPQAEEE